MLKYRILTALILIPLVIWGIFGLSQPIFIIITALVASLAAWEWASFLGWVKWQWRLLYVGIVLLGLIISLLLPNWVVIAIGAFWWMFVFVFIAWIELRKFIPSFNKVTIAAMGLLAIVPFWQSIVLLHLDPRWLLLLLLVVWLTDIAAYFGGRLLGRRKLAPIISPNKTWAGVYAAILIVTIFMVIGVWFMFKSWQPLANALTLTILAIIAAVVGDLFESLMKRQSGVKDSGKILPGHGGWLDRIDSLMAAAPIFICTAINLKILA